jgi:LysM repeat protein
MKKKGLHTAFSLAIAMFGFTLTTTAQNSDLTVEEYIATYKDIAIQEMERSGIPASITLAQGIHESAFGNSTLAKKANNHFGIKCASDWDGKTYYKWDDDANKSCFRVYKNAMTSYIDHTELLLKRSRYAFLFKYDRKDYKSWAKGLRKAGYATDPNYPNKLIHTIEKNNLAQYDKQTGTLVFDPKVDPELKDIPLFDGEDGYRTKEKSFLFTSYKSGFDRQNGATYAKAKKGESALAAAKRFGIPYRRFLKFNDLEDGDQLIAYQYIYLQPKKSKYRGQQAFHKVKNDETMYEIAQYYGIKLDQLIRKNLLEKGQEPLNGEMILLKDKAVRKPKLRAKDHIDAQPGDGNEDEATNNTTTTSNDTKKTIIKIPTVERPKPKDITLNTPTYDSKVYADTSNINTAILTDSSLLDINVRETVPTVKTKVITNPYENKSATTTNQTRNTNNQQSSSTNTNAVDNKGVNPNALFGGGKIEDKQTETTPIKNTDNPYGSNTNTTTSNTNTNVVSENPYGGNSNTTTNNANNRVVSENPYSGSVSNETIEPTNVTKTTVERTTNTKYQLHVVGKGDTLYSLQRKYNVPVSEIKKINYLTTNTLYLGRKLKIPVK